MQAKKATPAAATPAAMLQALQTLQTQQKQGVFLQALQSAFALTVVPPLVLGGVQAPQRAGQIANVWLCYLAQVQQGKTPTAAQLVALLPTANVNNTKIEAYRVARYMQAFATWYAQQQPAS